MGKLYLAVGGLIVLGYAFISWRGHEPLAASGHETVQSAKNDYEYHGRGGGTFFFGSGGK